MSSPEMSIRYFLQQIHHPKCPGDLFSAFRLCNSYRSVVQKSFLKIEVRNSDEGGNFSIDISLKSPVCADEPQCPCLICSYFAAQFPLFLIDLHSLAYTDLPSAALCGTLLSSTCLYEGALRTLTGLLLHCMAYCCPRPVSTKGRREH